MQYGLGVAIWDLGGGDELVLGTATIPTKDGMSGSYTEEFWGPTYDQFGTAPVDQIKVGESALITVNMAAMNLQAFADIFPAATLETDGVDATKKKVSFGGLIGESLLSYAKTLTIRPRHKFDANDGSLGDADEDVTLLKAIPRGNFSFNIGLQVERVYAVEFVGVVDLTTGKILVFGDNSADPTAT